LNPCILHPASECDLLVLIAGDIGKLGAWSSRRLVFFGANEGKFAVCAYRDVGGIVGLLLGTLSKFAGFGCSFLLCLGYREHYELEREGISADLLLLFLRLLQRVLGRRLSASRCGVTHCGSVGDFKSRCAVVSRIVRTTHISIVGQSQPRYPRGVIAN
jgi:hypothetical protein